MPFVTGIRTSGHPPEDEIQAGRLSTQIFMLSDEWGAEKQSTETRAISKSDICRYMSF
jgi:hypothetical protein